MRGFCLEVKGRNACFTRPEMKVERVSYDFITPSAARAIYEAIFWKPAILWKITRIEILAPIRWESIRRNEIGKVASERSSGILIEDDRQQRAGLLLRDVKYRLYAEFEFLQPAERPQYSRPLPDWLIDAEEARIRDADDSRADEKEAKYVAMFERRAKKGQTFHQPYFGCREFPVDFKLIPDPAKEPSEPVPELAGERDFGWMLYDMDYSNLNDPRPLFYRPKIVDGVVDVEKYRIESGVPEPRAIQLQRKEGRE